MWIIAKNNSCCKPARPGLLCPAIAKNQGGPGPCGPPFLSYAHVMSITSEYTSLKTPDQRSESIQTLQSSLKQAVVLTISKKNIFEMPTY